MKTDSSLQQVISNYINGNLSDAKQGATRYSTRKLFLYMKGTGFSENEARAVALYLKKEGTFQAACDARTPSKV